MARRGRPGMPEAQKDEMWRRWRHGSCGRSIPGFDFRAVASARRGDAATAPSWRTRAEREELSRGLAAGSSLRQIARELNRAPSPLNREVSRNTDQQRLTFPRLLHQR